MNRLPSSAAMTIVMLGALGIAAPSARAADGRCGAGRDLVVQALEAAGPQSTPDQFSTALQLIKRANAMCGELADAWYYRSLVEAKVGSPILAKTAADKARLLGSDAQRDGLQPFILATPVAAPAAKPLSVARRGMPDAVPSTPKVEAGKPAQKWALVIGISRFADHSVPQLNYTAGDAKAFADLLTNPDIGHFAKENVHVLTDGQATTKGIKTELNWIARHAQPQDMVVIYLATHGSPRETDSVGGLNYLVTYDTEIHSVDHPDEDALYATALPMVDLSSAVASRMQSLRTLVVLDTCYSGGSIKNGGKMMGAGLANAAPSEETLKRMSAGTGRIVLAASRVDQESLESDALRHGYFTYYLLKRLTESKGAMPISQIYTAVQKDVSDRVAADGRAEGLHQNPVMDRSADDADFSLALVSGGE